MWYIPSILTLQCHLMLRYRRRLDRAEAYKMTIRGIIRTENRGFNMQKLFDDFAAAWECVMENLLDYGCLSLHGGLVRLPQDSQLAILLPSTTGPGLLHSLGVPSQKIQLVSRSLLCNYQTKWCT
ncbi:uncharacterized protein LOC121366424 [Gigantopelta aegis]|uniref:uncharacterized protein LOC121366424 n=1 Tax=Gigantopelta aegis TaxID=1735272 RepID=UPI001B888917|nr:uncharacterized protein LOC121366424 [Gigantopelta aegis]